MLFVVKFLRGFQKIIHGKMLNSFENAAYRRLEIIKLSRWDLLLWQSYRLKLKNYQSVAKFVIEQIALMHRPVSVHDALMF